MPLRDGAQSLRNNVAAVLSSVQQSLSVENAKALPGKFVAAVSAVFSFVVNLVAKPFVWAWSKSPSAPQPSLWSRVSSFLFKPAPVLVPLQDLQELQGEKDELTSKVNTLESVLQTKQSEVSSVAAAVELLSAEKKALTGKIEELKSDLTTLTFNYESNAKSLRDELEMARAPVTPAATAAASSKSSVVVRTLSNVATTFRPKHKTVQ